MFPLGDGASEVLYPILGEQYERALSSLNGMHIKNENQLIVPEKEAGRTTSQTPPTQA